MLSRRRLLGTFVIAAALLTGRVTFASELTPFNEQAFAAAQAAGKPVLLEVHAPWCPVCKRQEPILSKLSKEPKFKEMVRFLIDFDSQKDLLRRFNVQKQSTLIAFKGRREAGRSTGDTNPESIEALLEKAI